MSTASSIEWTDATWNPVRGCSLVSAGCQNCYAMKQAHRFSGKGKAYEELTELGPQGPRWTGKITLVPEALEAPLRWKKPRRIFVNSMSDLFHEDVPDSFLAQVGDIIQRAQRLGHTFQILTKRPTRMRDYLRKHGRMPLVNAWFGVSVEDQATADERIPILLQTPAAVRFISAEPLLGSVDLLRWLPIRPVTVPAKFERVSGTKSEIDWVILGGESGPGARPCDLAWIRSIKEQCQAAQVPVFVKQLGARPYVDHDLDGVHRYVEASDCGIDLPGYVMKLKDKKGGDMAEWPQDLRIREFPQ